ncbi:MAG: extracellular solute-binding protein [Deltaproteobacteria bacterium]|nr:extracellular solute-binding protein [Deltaproteobacteria bacterium]
MPTGTRVGQTTTSSQGSACSAPRTRNHCRRGGAARPHWATTLLGAACVALLFAGVARAEPRHGLSLGGTLKYPKGFSHFEYANPNAPKGGTLNLSAEGSFDSLNPFALKGRSALLLGALVFESLATGSDDEPFAEYGLLAETIDLAADGLSVTFRLRPQARFSDGRPVEAQDVEFTFKALMGDAASPFYRYYYQDVKSVETPDKRTVRFVFTRRNNELAMILGQLPVLPRHVYSKGDFGKDFNNRAVGSGPYVMESVDFGKNIRYRRNKDYWGANLGVNKGRYNFDQVVVKYYRDQTVALEGFKSGEFDLLWVNSSKQWAVDVAGEKWDQGWIRKENLKHSNTAGMQGYLFNLRNPLFASREVRRAIALAFDFEWSNQNLFYGQYTENDSYFDNSELAAEGLPTPEELKLLEPWKDKIPPEVFTEPMGGEHPPEALRRRLRNAIELLRKAGWDVQDGVLTEASTGRKMVFGVTLVSPAFERITEPFLNNLSRLGIKVSMKVVDSAVYEQKLRAFDYDMIVSTFGQSQSPGNEQRDYWHSESAGQEGSRNLVGIRSPAVDALVEAVIAAKDRGSLLTATHALDRVLWHESYVVPHWYIASHRVTYWDKLRYPKKLPLYYYPTGHFTFWWVDSQAEKSLQAAVSGK